MSTKVNREAYQRLIDEDLVWLQSVPRTPERDHVIEIVKASPDHEYRDDARLHALEAEVKAWRDWSTFMPHSDRLTVEYMPVQRNAIRKASKATDATRGVT